MPSCNTTPSTLLKCNENLKRLLIVSVSVLPSRLNQCNEWSRKQTNKIKTRIEVFTHVLISLRIASGMEIAHFTLYLLPTSI